MKRVDLCGVCGGSNLCLDCQGTPWGEYRMDRCGACAIPVYAWEGGGTCEPTLLRAGEWNECVDCRGAVNGTAEEDSCGVCGGSDGSCARGFEVLPLEGEVYYELCQV